MGKFGDNFGDNYDTFNEEIEFTVGENTDVKFSKEGRIQIRAKKNIAVIQQKDKPAFTTTSTTFVDVGMLPAKYLPKQLSTKNKQNKLKQIYQQFRKNKNFLKKLSEKSPLELEWLDVNLGLVRARFKPKKMKKSK